jgi:hypothetical protein
MASDAPSEFQYQLEEPASANVIKQLYYPPPCYISYNSDYLARLASVNTSRRPVKKRIVNRYEWVG